MASLICILLVTALTGQFPKCFAESRKELRNKKDVNPENFIQLGSSIQTTRIDPSRVVQLSWRPRVFLYEGFLTDEECDHLISLAQGRNETSVEKGDNSRKIVKTSLLGSPKSRLNINDDIFTRIEEKISAWTFLPKENGKPLQVMRYGLEEAKQNFDYFGNKSMSARSEPLMATLVFYLSNVTKGGEILFPQSELRGKIWSDCTKTSYVSRPIKGNAILFFTVHANAYPDTSSAHVRCPVLEGEMWCAKKFFFLRAIDRGKALSESDGDECTDEDDHCPWWAASGECQRNPVFMVGSPDYYGTCRKSCNAC